MSYFVFKRIGKSPIVLPKDDSAYGLVGQYFKLTLVGLLMYVIALVFVSDYNTYFLPIQIVEHRWVQYFGMLLMSVSFVWVTISQYHMRDSWRIGIDKETKTELITKGVFSVSRNPIFLGMIVSLAGLFMATPNIFTLVFLLTGYILIQIQIRLEEDFLSQQHGEHYIHYKRNVRRFL